MEDRPTISIVLDERAVRALSQAVNFTMEKWTGQEEIDQDERRGVPRDAKENVFSVEMVPGSTECFSLLWGATCLHSNRQPCPTCRNGDLAPAESTKSRLTGAIAI